jgi:NAD(P)-dependent dehydrogenase (short-subunit alcohol dehydrogenase family)
MSGRVVLVTGGTKGVGKGIAAAFSGAGAQVVVCGRHPPEPGDDQGHQFIACDVRQPEQVDELFAAILERHNRIDVVVNNAGGAPYAEAATASPRFSTAIVTLNLLAPLFVAQRANQTMQAQAEGGSIINIASISGLRPSPGAAAYGAAKAGLISLTQTLAMEWAPKVRVNCISAGMVLTETAHLFYGDEQGVAAVAATVPIGRLAEPSDIGNLCVFLASPLAGYVSGANLVAHGAGERPPFLDAGNADHFRP